MIAPPETLLTQRGPNHWSRTGCAHFLDVPDRRVADDDAGE